MAYADSAEEASNAMNRPASYRWLQLLIGIICMAMIANLQYGWTLFVDPISAKFGWERKAIQWAFTLFVLAETWLVPVEGYLVDRFGPRPVVLVGGVLCGLGWILNSMADSLGALYFAAIVSGIGAGAVYGTCVGNAVKWFADKRGLAVGLTAAGFGAGSALTIAPISAMIKTDGYQDAFLYFGVIQGIVVVVLAMLLSDPRRVKSAMLAQKVVKAPSAAVIQTKRDFTPMEILRQPVFWLLYVMFVLMAIPALTATAQLALIAKDMHIADTPVTIAGLTLAALTFALSIDRVLNGLTRPFFGWVSDQVGREKTMLIAFSLEAVGILALYAYGSDPVAFVILSGLVFFASGEIYSLFPSTCTDTFGTRFGAANAGALYTAKGTAALLIPFGNDITKATGSWHTVFLGIAATSALAALLAWFVLRPMRARFLQQQGGSA